MTFGSLFAGIGGFDLGFERAGMTCKWQVEIDEYCQRVLAKHWPNVYRARDIRECGARNLEHVDVICGGFPCQDVSWGNPSGPGISGERSGLWTEMLRCICEIRPRYVVVENVPALLDRGLGRVLGDLAGSGFDAEWRVLPSSLFGACHYRRRVFVVAYADGERLEGYFSQQIPEFPYLSEIAACGDVETVRERPGTPEPLLYRDGNGVSGWMDRLRGLGNAVVPQVAEWIGRRIMEADDADAQAD